MQLSEAQALLKRITYKPGYRFELQEDLHTGDTLVRIVSMEPDATRKQPGTIPIQSVQRVSLELMDEGRFLKVLREAIRYRELHEMDEWFQVDGVAPFYPH